MSCAGRREALVAYLERELGAAERTELEAHLAGCEACRLTLDAERRISGALASLAPVAPSPDFEARFWARVARERDAERGGFLARLLTRRFALGFGAAAAAALAALLMLRPSVEGADVDLQIVATPDDLELLEDLDVIEVVDVLEEFEGDRG